MFFSSFFSGRCSYLPHHRLFSLFYFQAVLILFTSPPIFSFLFSGGAHAPHITAYFRFSIFRRCSYLPHHRPLSLFYFQAVLIPFTPPPTFSFLFSSGAHALHITAYFFFFIFRRCSYPSHHRLFSLFYFQAVLTPFTPPPTFAFSFPGGAHAFLTTAYFRFFIFRRCSYLPHHRLFSLFYFQAVLTPFTSPPTFSFLFSGGAHTLHTTAYFRFSIFRRCSYLPHHRLFSLFYFQAVLIPSSPPPTFSFLFPGGAHALHTTAHFRFFIFRRCSRPSRSFPVTIYATFSIIL